MTSMFYSYLGFCWNEWVRTNHTHPRGGVGVGSFDSFTSNHCGGWGGEAQSGSDVPGARSPRKRGQEHSWTGETHVWGSCPTRWGLSDTVYIQSTGVLGGDCWMPFSMSTLKRFWNYLLLLFHVKGTSSPRGPSALLITPGPFHPSIPPDLEGREQQVRPASCAPALQPVG